MASVSLTQSWFTNESVVYGMNGVTWTLACEAAFYAAFVDHHAPWPCVGQGRWAIAAGWYAAALTLSLASEHLGLARSHGEGEPVTRFNEFLIGVVAAVAFTAGGGRA